jgi:hypothetical protein
MRKLIIAGMAVAMLAIIPAAASADVPRCAAPVTGPSAATFSVLQPRGAFSQWENVWQHDYTVMVQPDGSFVGTGSEYNREAPADGSVAETISGKFDSANNTVTFTALQGSGGQTSYTLTNIKTDGIEVQNAVTVPVSPYGVVESKVTAPQFAAPTLTDLNHGEYVSSQGGGKIAAKCAGMPKNSTQGVK